jgi:hypothetical protein
MTKRTEKTGGTQGANREATSLGRLLAPLVDRMTTTRRQWLAWVQSAGLVALEAVCGEEAAALATPRGCSASRRGRGGGGVRRSLAAARRAIAAFGSESTIARGAAIWVSPIVRNFAWSNMESMRTVTITAAAALSQIQQLAGHPRRDRGDG